MTEIEYKLLIDALNIASAEYAKSAERDVTLAENNEREAAYRRKHPSPLNPAVSDRRAMELRKRAHRHLTQSLDMRELCNKMRAEHDAEQEAEALRNEQAQA